MRRDSRKGGFTMIEVMIAVAIIGILAAVSIPAFQNYQNRSRRAEAFANLGAIAQLEKSYFTEYTVYVPVAPQPAVGSPDTKRAWTPLAEAAYGTIGFHPDGAVLYDYGVAVDLAQCPQADCFTAIAYGDANADGQLALIMYAQPNANAQVTLDPLFPALGLPLDPVSGRQRINEVAVNYQADLY